jgi:hypothetical protein
VMVAPSDPSQLRSRILPKLCVFLARFNQS